MFPRTKKITYNFFNINFYANSLNIHLFFKSKNEIFKLYLPPKFFYKKINETFKIKFLSFFYFKSFITNMLYLYHQTFKYNLIRLRIKGLGYYIAEISKNIISFFFNRINFIYFFCPIQIFMKIYKKRIILLSKNKCMLHLILYHILKLKKLGPYNMLGFKIPKFFMLLHNNKKKI